jgi:carboxyl-terminal processing protease
VHQANVETLDDTPDRREADLRGRLLNDQDNGGQPEGSGAVSEAGEPPTEGEDYQLSRALDLLRGISLYEGRALAGSKG